MYQGLKNGHWRSFAGYWIHKMQGYRIKQILIGAIIGVTIEKKQTMEYNLNDLF